MIVLLCIAAAVGAEPADPGPDADEEIVVFGQLAIAKAHDAIVRDLESLGYQARRKDGQVVFRPPDSWMGKAILHDDGRLTFTKPIVALQGAVYQGTLSTEVEDNLNVNRDGATGTGGASFALAPSDRKLEGVRQRVANAIQPELDAYVAVVRRTAIEESLLALPDRLDATWTGGTPLDGGSVQLTTPEARRHAILEMWATRTDTSEGRRTCGAIEAWLSATVQESEHPITEDERSAYQERRSDGRMLP